MWDWNVTIFFFFASILLVSVVASVLSAQMVVNARNLETLGAFSTGLVGVAVCFLVSYGLFFLLDPDPVSNLDIQVPLYQRTLPITGFSACIWLPIYTTLFNKLRRKRQAA